MKNNYKFFQNRDCEFFPCHKIENEDSFNCLFCYCPLYLKENCLGSPDYILNGKGQKIRDCSNCTIVHRPEMYETVIAQFQKQDCVVFVSIWDLKDEIMARIAEIASWEQMEPESRKEHKDEAEKTVMRFYPDTIIETGIWYLYFCNHFPETVLSLMDLCSAKRIFHAGYWNE